MGKWKIIFGLGILGLLVFTLLFLWSRSWSNSLFMRPLDHLESPDKVIALTFDDGPSLVKTSKLLELLEAYQVKATFFMLGSKISLHPEIAQRVYQKGHLIGNHTYSHLRMIFKMPQEMIQEITLTDELIKKTGQKDVAFFRPPYTSKFIILPLVLNYLNKTLVTGSYDPPAEYKSPINPILVSQQILENSKSGSIIYLHDGDDRDMDNFLSAVEMTIQGLIKQGYKFVRIDQKPIQI